MPTRPVRSEASIQRAVIDYAKKRGCLCKKMEAGRFGSSGWPDFMVLYGGRSMFIEFKRPGGKLTDLQAENHRALGEMRFPVHTVDDVAQGRGIVATFVAGGVS